jgi:rubredoxin
MARGFNSIVECDVCGFEYRRSIMKKNSYGLMVCPRDFDGAYDLKNHPQNKPPNISEKSFIRNARPENNNDRNAVWELANTKWEDITKYWNNV